MYTIISSYICSFSKGLILSGSVYAVGWIMDRTISKHSREIIIKKDKQTYEMGEKYVMYNLLVISPIAYTILYNLVLNHTNHCTFSIFPCMGLLFIQNIGYYCIHYEMHRSKRLLWIHNFHHKYDNITMPSVANAVTCYEFMLAYISPMVVGAYIIKPTELEFVSAIALISFFNLLIHTYELNNVKWCTGLVSPTHHIVHHKERNMHYAAPLLNVDEYMYYVSEYMLKKSNK